MFFLTLIALERVYVVLCPLRHRAGTTIVYICGVLFIWLVGSCITGLSLSPMYYKKVEKRYVTLSIHTCLFIALLVICASYIKIRNQLRRTSPEIGLQHNRSTEKNLRLSRTMFVVIGASFVFWLTAFVLYTVGEFARNVFPACLLVRECSSSGKFYGQSIRVHI